MNELRTLCNLLSIQKLKQIDILTESSDSSSKTDQLLKAIREEIVENDDDAILLLYPNTAKPEIPYSKLKYRLKQRLLNTLFFTDVQQYSRSPYEKALVRSYKNWSAGQILYNKGLTKIARSLFESQLRTCQKYDITELSLSIIQSQKYRYGLFEYDKRKFKKYKKLYEVTKTKYDLRIKTEDFYIELAHKVTRAKSLVYDDEVKQIESELIGLIPEIENTDEYFMRFYFYNCLYYINMFKNDFENQSDICEKALRYFKTKIGFPNLALFSFNQKRGLTALYLKRYDRAIEYFDTCIEYKPPEGGIAWQFVNSYKFFAFILKREYGKAYETTSLVLNNKTFKKINKKFGQPWHLKEAFIHFLIRIKKINPDLHNVQPLRKFRLGRFLNEVTIISQDKQGVNITINILQLLFLVLDKKYDKVLDKINALKQYSFRHLKQDRHIRARTFIKMLQKIPVGDYNPSNISHKTQKHLTILKQNPMLYTEDQMQLEIIPYEQMWEELLEAFDQKKN